MLRVVSTWMGDLWLHFTKNGCRFERWLQIQLGPSKLYLQPPVAAATAAAYIRLAAAWWLQISVAPSAVQRSSTGCRCRPRSGSVVSRSRELPRRTRVTQIERAGVRAGEGASFLPASPSSPSLPTSSLKRLQRKREREGRARRATHKYLFALHSW